MYYSLFTRFASAYTPSGHEYFVCEGFQQARTLYENARSMDRRQYNAWCGVPSTSMQQQIIIPMCLACQEQIDVQGKGLVDHRMFA